jgi:hypothetical protein
MTETTKRRVLRAVDEGTSLSSMGLNTPLLGLFITKTS